MADYQNLTTALGTAANLNQPTATISVQVTDSADGHLLADFTGANAIQFPAVLATLTPAQFRAVLDKITTDLISYKMGA